MFENLVVAMYSNGVSGKVIWAVKRQLTVSGTCQTCPFYGHVAPQRLSRMSAPRLSIAFEHFDVYIKQ